MRVVAGLMVNIEILKITLGKGYANNKYSALRTQEKLVLFQ